MQCLPSVPLLMALSCVIEVHRVGCAGIQGVRPLRSARIHLLVHLAAVQTYEPHSAYDMKYLETIKPTHRPPVDLADRVSHKALSSGGGLLQQCPCCLGALNTPSRRCSAGHGRSHLSVI